jgi:hypothetical protein
MSREFGFHLLAALAYFFLVSVLRWQWDLSVLGLWLGVVLGTFLLDADHFLYWYLNPQKEDSLAVQALWQAKGLAGAKDFLRLAARNSQSHRRLIFHTATFQLVLIALGFFVLSSSRSSFGWGVVLAMNLHLLFDQWGDFLKKGKATVADRFFWQVRLPMEKYLNIYLAGATLSFLLLTALII